MKKETEKSVHGLRLMVIGCIAAIVIVIATVYLVFSGRQTLKLAETSTGKYEDAMYNGYKLEIKSQVQAAIAIIQGYYDLFQEGTFATEEEAKNAAKESIRSMRYRDDDSGYLWIDGMDCVLVMHPILPEQEGTNRKDMEDQNGVMITQEIVKAAESGGGYNQFYFTKSDGKTVAPKLAYSEEFEPWGWAVATGNYIDDMQKEIDTTGKDIQNTFRSMIINLIVLSVVILIVAIVIAILVGNRIALPIVAMERDLEQIANGDLRFKVNTKYIKRKDEIGKMAVSMETVRASLSTLVGGISSLAQKLQADSQSFSDHFENVAQNIGSVNRAVGEIAEGATSQASDTELVSNKVKDLEYVIDMEKDAVSRLETAITSMMDYSDNAVKNIELLSSISEKTNHAVTFVNEQTQKTNESVGNIQQAIAVITSIAEQTSLLSLNASIEAARAGEQGKGFAVVAEEIRKLADESNKSASEIGEVVSLLISNSDLSVDRMQDVSSNVQEQMNRLKETKTSFESLYEEIKSVEEVSGNIDVQTSKLEDLKKAVSDSVSSLASVIEQSAAGAQETSANMNMLNANIDGSVDDLTELVTLNDDLMKEIGKFQV